MSYAENQRAIENRGVSGTLDAEDYNQINRGKENFDTIYNRDDPRSYFRTLGDLDYVIPGKAKPVFAALIEELSERSTDGRVKVLDLGCSYGINAALLKYDLDLQDLYDHYTPLPATTDDLPGKDADFFAEQTADRTLEVVGLDVAGRAIQYAVDTGILDAGVTTNLEEGSLQSQEAELINGTDLIISTGCIGYVTDATFKRVLAACDSDTPPWIASFVLRMFPYQSIEDTLQNHGLATEKLVGHSFVQRTFSSNEEKAHTANELESVGLDAHRELRDECFYADFYLSRPRTEIIGNTLQNLIEGALPT